MLLRARALLPRGLRRSERPSPRLPASAARRGQALVEFAIVLPVLLLLLVIAIDFGRVFFGWVSLQNAARIGANYAGTHPAAWFAPDTAQKAAWRQQYLDEITREAPNASCALSSPPAPAFSAGGAMGSEVSVTLTCGFTPVTPLVSSIVGRPVPVRATAVMPVRQGAVPGLPSPSVTCSAPNPSFAMSLSPNNGKAPLTVTFTDTSTTAPGCAATSWSWDFGDGSANGSGASTTHTYTTAGTYTATLTIANSAGPTTTSHQVKAK